MKRILILLLLVSLFSTAFSQINNSYSYVNEYRLKLNGEWQEWDTVSSPILIYLDWGFGYLSVMNKLKQRFIFSEVLGSLSADNFSMIVVHAYDNAGTYARIVMTFYSKEDLEITIAYSEKAAYSYKIKGKIEGYPSFFFKPEEKEDIKEEKEIIPPVEKQEPKIKEEKQFERSEIV